MTTRSLNRGEGMVNFASGNICCRSEIDLGVPCRDRDLISPSIRQCLRTSKTVLFYSQRLDRSAQYAATIFSGSTRIRGEVITMNLALQILQTVGVIGALVFASWGFFARACELRFQNYLSAMSGFVDLQKMLIEKQELHSLYEYSEKDLEKGKYEEMSQDEKTLIHYCDTIIAVCETVWRACQEKWLHKDEWQYWRDWLQDISASPHFRWTLKWVAQTERQYDERFLKDLMEIIPSRRAPGT